MIKPNSDDMKALLGIEVTDRRQLLQAAQKIQANGIEVVVISLGKDGALAICDEGIFQGVTPDMQNLCHCQVPRELYRYDYHGA